MKQNPIFQDGSAQVTGILAAGNTIVATILNKTDAKYLFFQFDLITQALDAFIVQGRGNRNAALADFSPAAWATPGAPGNATRVKETSGNLAAQAAASSGWFGMDITGLEEIVVSVSAAVNGAAVTPRWSLQ